MMQLIPGFGGVGSSASPGLCYRCRSHVQHDAPVVSTGIWVEMEGLVEFCRQCVVEMASLYGLIAPDKAEALRKSNRSLGQQLKAQYGVQASLDKQVSALNDQIEALKDTIKDSR